MYLTFSFISQERSKIRPYFHELILLIKILSLTFYHFRTDPSSDTKQILVTESKWPLKPKYLLSVSLFIEKVCWTLTEELNHSWVDLVDDIPGKTLKKHASSFYFQVCITFSNCFYLCALSSSSLNVWSNSQVFIYDVVMYIWVCLHCILRHTILIMIALILFISMKTTTLLIFFPILLCNW